MFGNVRWKDVWLGAAVNQRRESNSYPTNDRRVSNVSQVMCNGAPRWNKLMELLVCVGKWG